MNSYIRKEKVAVPGGIAVPNGKEYILRKSHGEENCCNGITIIES